MKFREAYDNGKIYEERLNLTKRHSVGKSMFYETYCENVRSYSMLFFFEKNSTKSHPHYLMKVNYIFSYLLRH